MINNHPLTLRNVASIGEEIGYELGAQLVKNYQNENPNSAWFFNIGRDILVQILAQPGCHGIRFYNAINETGEQTLVYLGLDSQGHSILEFSVVNSTGILENHDGIVADRATRGGNSVIDDDTWNWTID